jgi:hypothetical protein
VVVAYYLEMESPLKTRMFMWLAMVNKILTWENGKKQGWQGLNRCTLCMIDEESVNHLFVSCPLVVQVLQEVLQAMKCPRTLNCVSLEQCMWNWVRNLMNRYFKDLPYYVMWEI